MGNAKKKRYQARILKISSEYRVVKEGMERKLKEDYNLWRMTKKDFRPISKFFFLINTFISYLTL
jgi:hypothetical protein